MKITLLTSKLDLNRIERQKVKTFVFRHVLEQISTLSDYLSIHFPVRWRGKWLRGLWLVCVLFCSEMLWKHWFWKESCNPTVVGVEFFSRSETKLVDLGRSRNQKVKTPGEWVLQSNRLNKSCEFFSNIWGSHFHSPSHFMCVVAYRTSNARARNDKNEQ